MRIKRMHDFFHKQEMSEIDKDNEGALVPTTPPRKKRVVQAALIDHTYTDYSNYPTTTTNADDSNRGQASADNFPKKLHHILSNPEYHHIISWMPHGRAWKIWNKELLVSVVCKEQFKHEKFESFNRQVNGWGFKRLFSNGPDYKCYYNQFFLRGLPDLARHMHRLDKPGKRLPNKLEEPDLYEISRRFPLPETNAGSSGTEAPRKYEPSTAPFDSSSLTLPYSYRSCSEERQAQDFKFDDRERVARIDTVPSPSSASTAPNVVSRGSSENKAYEADSLQGKSHASFLVQDDQVSRNEIKTSKANNTSSKYNTSQFREGSSNFNRSEENYTCHVKTHDPYSCNKSFDAKESRYTIPQEHYRPLFHEKISQPVNCKISSSSLYDHDIEVNHDQRATTKDDSSCSTEQWDHYPLQEHYEDQDHTQQEWQQYYAKRTQGHVMPHSIPFEHQDYNSSMYYTSGHVPHCHAHYQTGYQCYNNTYSDPFVHHHYKPTAHYAQSSVGIESNPPVAEAGNYSFPSRSQYHHQVQQQYEHHYPVHQMPDTTDTWGHNNAFNGPFHPHADNSNDYYTPTMCAFDSNDHYHKDIDTKHHLQPQCLSHQTTQGGSQSLKNDGSKWSALDTSFKSYNPEDTSPNSHHSLSPLSNLMESFLDFEPSQSMFDDKPK